MSFYPKILTELGFLSWILLSGSKSWSGSGFHFEIQFHNYISYIKVTHQIWFPCANFFISIRLADQDLDQDFTLKFNTRTTFYIFKTPTKFGFDPSTPSTVIGSTDIQTDSLKCKNALSLFLGHTKHVLP